jgi:hypothetical protein
MARPRLTRGLTLALGVIYLAAGIAVTVPALRPAEGGLWFWCGTLVGGGSLVLGGLVTARRHPRVGGALICIGCLLGILATSRTIVIPLFALWVVVLNVRESTAPDAHHQD